MGRRAARMAGKSPPTRPISAASTYSSKAITAHNHDRDWDGDSGRRSIRRASSEGLSAFIKVSAKSKPFFCRPGQAAPSETFRVIGHLIPVTSVARHQRQSTPGTFTLVEVRHAIV